MFTLDPILKHDTFLLASLPFSELLLMNDSQYPWLILVPRKKDCTEIVELSSDEKEQLHKESDALSFFLLEEVKAEKLNIAALGNVVSQLHIHHIARFKNDIAWPKPVWGFTESLAYSIEEYEQLIIKIKNSKLYNQFNEAEWKV